jgi:hypothetical protein
MLRGQALSVGLVVGPQPWTFFFLIVELGGVDPLFGQEAVDLGFESVVLSPARGPPKK